nr:uncharacterized protein LOC121121664 [Lepeophtheirus salmonis]
MSFSSEEEEENVIINSGLSLSTVVRTLRWVSRARVSAWFAEAFSFSVSDMETDSTVEDTLQSETSLLKINSRKDNKYNGIEDEDEDSKKWDLERNKSPLKSRMSNKKVNMKLTQDNIMEWFLLSATGTNKSKEYYSSLLDKQMKDTLQQKEIDSN